MVMVNIVDELSIQFTEKTMILDTSFPVNENALISDKQFEFNEVSVIKGELMKMK